MSKINTSDRAALEQAYPPEAFVEDSAQNAAASPEIVKGVRVLSAPDAAGEFELERGHRQVGEAASAAFLAPYRRVPAAVPSETPGSPPDGYQAFLDEIVDAARRFGFRPGETPGQGDPRIRGLRQ